MAAFPGLPSGNSLIGLLAQHNGPVETLPLEQWSDEELAAEWNLCRERLTLVKNLGRASGAAAALAGLRFLF